MLIIELKSYDEIKKNVDVLSVLTAYISSWIGVICFLGKLYFRNISLAIKVRLCIVFVWGGGADKTPRGLQIQTCSSNNNKN